MLYFRSSLCPFWTFLFIIINSWRIRIRTPNQRIHLLGTKLINFSMLRKHYSLDFRLDFGWRILWRLFPIHLSTSWWDRWCCQVTIFINSLTQFDSEHTSVTDIYKSCYAISSKIITVTFIFLGFCSRFGRIILEKEKLAYISINWCFNELHYTYIANLFYLFYE